MATDALHCPVCGGAPALLDSESWAADGTRYQLARCNACASSSTTPPPSDAVLARVYDPQNGYDYLWFRHHYPAKLVDAVVRIHELRAAGIEFGPRVLDLGGGLGYFARAARLFGYKAETFDPVYAPRAQPPSGTFDSVVMLHVLEHCSDLDSMVVRTRSLLRPGGTLIAAVPNAASEGYCRRGNAWVWAQPPLVHVHHISERGLRALLTRHGYVVDRIHYAERWDANRISDIALARQFRALERMYRWSPVKPVTALGNSLARAAALTLAKAGKCRVPESLSELCISARAPQ